MLLQGAAQLSLQFGVLLLGGGSLLELGDAIQGLLHGGRRILFAVVLLALRTVAVLRQGVLQLVERVPVEVVVDVRPREALLERLRHEFVGAGLRRGLAGELLLHLRDLLFRCGELGAGLRGLLPFTIPAGGYFGPVVEALLLQGRDELARLSLGSRFRACPFFVSFRTCAFGLGPRRGGFVTEGQPRAECGCDTEDDQELHRGAPSTGIAPGAASIRSPGPTRRV